jgi:hypothetical protein
MGPRTKWMIGMAKYLILIYGNEQRWDEMSEADRRQIDEGHQVFRTKAGAAVLASGELESSSTATTLRAGDAGKAAITDGPFLESKEVIGGFYVIEAADLDDAISLVSGLAEVWQDHSGVQIQPLVDHG